MRIDFRSSAALDEQPSLAFARAVIAGYEPYDESQAAVRADMLAFIDEHPRDAHRRSCRPGHLTASALVVDPAAEHFLLHHHRKLDRWLQFGGHCDGDANLLACAWRETTEEAGIEPGAISSAPVDLDIHTIPAHGREPEHLHLDTRYLIRMARDSEPVVSAESKAVRWFSAREVRALSLDDSVARLVELAVGQ